MRSQWLEAIRACGINLAYSSTDGVEKNMDRLALITLSLIVVAATAQASLIGTDVTVSFVEEGFSDLVDIVTVDGARHEIVPFDGTNIGNQILLDTFSPDTEFIDIANERIVVGLEGSGDPHPVFAGHNVDSVDRPGNAPPGQIGENEAGHWIATRKTKNSANTVPRAQKWNPVKFLVLPKYSRWIRIADLPFRNPTVLATLYFGGILRHR